MLIHQIELNVLPALKKIRALEMEEDYRQEMLEMDDMIAHKVFQSNQRAVCISRGLTVFAA